MKKRKIIFIVILFFIGIVKINAAYLNSYVSKYTNPDGKEITIYITGDEYFRYAHDKKKNVLIKNDLGYYTYATLKDGKVVSTNIIYDNKNIPSNTIKVSDIDLSKNQELVHNFENNNIKKESFTSSKKRSQKEGSIENVLNFNTTIVFIRFSGENEFVNDSFISSLQGVLGSTNNDETGLKSYVNKVTEGHVNANSNVLQINNKNKYYSYLSTHPRGYLQAYSSKNTYGFTSSDEGDRRLIEILLDAVSSLPETAKENVDANGDGKVDNFIFIVSGYSDDWSDPLWPHKWNLRAFGSSLMYSNALVDTYNLQFADSGDLSGKESVFCHETMHSLGLPDLYRYSYDGDPVGYWDMMNIDQEGSYVTTQIRNRYGYTKTSGEKWSSEPTVISKSGKYELNLASTNSGIRSYRINTSDSKQFLQLEYRGTSGDIYDYNLPYNGLIVSRINTNYTGNEGNGYDTEDEYYIYRPNETNYQGEYGDGEGDIDLAAISPCPKNASCSNVRGNSNVNSNVTSGAFTLENGTNTRVVIKNVQISETNKIKFSIFLNGDVAYLENDSYIGTVGDTYNVSPVYVSTVYNATCTSSDSSIATVDSSCNVTLVAPGQTTINVSINGKTYYSSVEVLPAKIDSITASINNAERIKLTYNLLGYEPETYLIYRSNDGVNFTLIDETTQTTYYDTNFDFGNTYYYKVGFRYNGTDYNTDKIVTVNTLDYLPSKTVINTNNANTINSATITFKDVNADGYNIYVSDNPIGPFEKLTSVNTTTYTFTDLEVAKNYYVKVGSYNVTNSNPYEAEYSDVVIVNTREKLIEATKITNGQLISLDEIRITYNAKENATGYNIYVSNNNKDFELLKEDNKGLGYTHEGIEFGKTYYYKVSAILDNTYEGYRSNSYKVVANQITPQNFEVKSNGYESILISYEEIQNADGYEIYYSEDNVKFKKLITTTSTTYTHKKLKFKKSYYYKVRSYRVVDDKNVYSNFTAVLNAKPLTSSPRVTISQEDNGIIKLKYSSDSYANSYKIYIKKSDSDYSLLTTTSKLEYTIKNLVLGEKVFIKVVSYKDKTKGNESVIEYDVTLRSPVIKLDTNTNTISIDGVKNATGYNIYKCEVDCELIANTTNLTYTSEQINNNGMYAYYVVAYNNDYLSYKSNIVSNISKYNIESFNAVASNSNEVTINVNTNNNFDGYELYASQNKKTGFKKVVDSKNIEFKYNKTIINNTYYFKIRPYKVYSNKKVYASYSEVVTYKQVLNKINSIELTNNTNNSVKITFDKVNNASGYYLYYSSDGENYTKIATLKTNSYIHNSLTYHSTAYYKVRSYMKVDGKKITSAYGEAKSIEVKSPIPKYTITSLSFTSVRIDIDGSSTNTYVINYGISENSLTSGVLVNGNTITISNLNSMNTYYFKVMQKVNGVNGDGEVKSHRLNALTPNVNYVINSNNKATLNWDSIGDNVFYEVYLQNNKIYDGNLTSLEQENLVTGKEYTYKLRSYIIVNEEKIYSNYKEVSVRCLFDKIDSFITTINSNLNILTIDFDKVKGNVAYYKLLYTNSLNSEFKDMAVTNTNRFSNVSVEPGKTYYLKVVAVSLYKDEEYYASDSNIVTFKAIPYTTNMINKTDVTYNSQKISWSKVNDISGYELYFSTKEKSGYKKLTAITSNSYVHKSLKPSVKYYYKVRTYKTINGKKYYSNYSEVFTYSPRPASVKNLKVTRYKQSAYMNKITWSKASYVTGYYVYTSYDGANYSYIGQTTSTSFIDKDASYSGTYYKVKSYKTVSGKKYFSNYSDEVYMRSPILPEFSITNLSTQYSDILFSVKGFRNYGSKKLTILSSGAYSIDNDYGSFNRKMSLADLNTGNKISKVVINANSEQTIAFRFNSSTWIDDKTCYFFYIVYDGVKYKVGTSYYYGTRYDFA